MRRTEGWPAGIYLTALALRAGAPAPVGVRGDDTFVADYLKHEVLGRQSSTRLGFLTRSSILSRLSGPLCDHVLEAKGSARLLERLQGSNLLIVPLDRTRTWYRYHSLFQDFLRSELERREPEQVMPLHSRAASWLQEHGEPELAIEHAMAANEPDRAAQMVSVVARLTYAQGRIQTLSGWFNWLEDHGTMARYPVLAAVGSLARALDGDERGADRLAVHAFYDSVGQPWSDDILSPVARILRSLKAESGLDQSLTDARAARSALPRSSEWLHLAIAAEALALTAMGDNSDAEIAWAEAVRIGAELEAQPVTTLGLAETALIASSKGDWATTEDLVERALEQISEGGLELYISSALVFVMAARLFIRRGNLAEAQAHMGRAAAIRPALTIGIPAVSIQAMLEMTKTFIELVDVAGARRVMREASDIVAARPQLGSLRTEHEELKERLAALPAGSVGPTSLSSAELRLLPMLATHLSYPEIGERLFVSRHTVKTQAGSIYRKLGVSSRAEAVDAARTIGLLGS
jgi:LuxR family transcriptional regulator, maltose regulon positive regulatory protein